MYSKQEASRLRQEFWTAFGQYMLPIPSADGERVNWINYKTGEKHIAFRMDADNKKASIAIELSHKDEGIRQLYFEQFHVFRNLLHQTANEEWIWEPQGTTSDGRSVSRIFQQLDGVSVFKKEDWPSLIAFFKSGLQTLDAFWSQIKYSFEALR
jgi:hypothetical protein